MPTVPAVSAPSCDIRYSLNIVYEGVVRKLLGLSFIGETRDDDEMVVGDVDVYGLNRDVRFLHTCD